MKELSEKTLIPLGIVFTLAGALIGGVMWLTTVHLTTIANAERIVEVKATVESYDLNQKKMFDAINQIKSDLQEIKVEIKYLRKQ